LKGHETLGSVCHFRLPESEIFEGRETLDPQVHSIHRTSVWPFGSLTMRFFKGHETLGYMASDEQLFVILAS
jgi:hypothetical protein